MSVLVPVQDHLPTASPVAVLDKVLITALQEQVIELERLCRISGDAFGVENIRHGSDKYTGCDRFTLVITYCMVELKWDIIFNAAYPSYPPDAVPVQLHLDSDVDPYSLYSLGDVPSLANWSITRASALYEVAVDLRKTYVAYQEPRMLAFPGERVAFNFEAAKHREHVEYMVSTRADTVQAVIVVGVWDNDGSEEQSAASVCEQQEALCGILHPKELRQGERVRLLVRFSVPSSQPPETVLMLPSSMGVSRRAIRSIPQWTNEMTLFDYLPAIAELVLANHTPRRDFVAEVRRRFTTLEFDGVDAAHVTAVCRVSSNSGGTKSKKIHLMRFSLGADFPMTPPRVEISDASPPFRPPRTLDTASHSFRYSPRWPASRMVDVLVEQIMTTVFTCSVAGTTPVP